MTLLRLLRQARRLYPLLSSDDILIAGLEELIHQNKRHAFQRPDPVCGEEFWITKWTTPDWMDDYPPSLPTMYTVWHKGTPVMDTPTPNEWIQEQVENKPC